MTENERARRALERACQDSMNEFCAEPMKTVMGYALQGGKGLRGLLLISSARSCGGEFEPAIGPAVAIEMLHGASLVVDDLPALDESDTRRGRPALHRRFGESHAILAAHALVATAFQVLSATVLEADRVVALVGLFSAAVGARGMALGELLDLEKGDSSDRTVDTLKTAILFQIAAEAGGVVAGAGDELLAHLGEVGAAVGCCYPSLGDLEGRPVRDEAWMGRRAGFETELAAISTRFSEIQPHLSDKRPLELWLNWVCSLARPGGPGTQ